MEHPGVFLIIVLVVLVLFFTLVVGHLALLRYDFFRENAFPEQPPSWRLILSKDPRHSDLLLVFFCTRAWAVCATTLYLVLASGRYASGHSEGPMRETVFLIGFIWLATAVGFSVFGPLYGIKRARLRRELRGFWTKEDGGVGRTWGRRGLLMFAYVGLLFPATEPLFGISCSIFLLSLA